MKTFFVTFLCALWLVPAFFTGPAAASSVVIAPHRAVYKMALLSAKNSSHVRNVTGQIEYEWADTCDAWATQQHVTMHFVDMDGEEREIVSHVLATETKDGKEYQFNIRRYVDGKEDDSYKGTANLSGKGGQASYVLPKDWADKPLPEGAMFPSAHTILIIQKAQAGEKMFLRPVFDGSDEEGIADVSAFIGAGSDPKATPDLAASVRGNALLAGQAWPVRLAFFEAKESIGTPDYEMDMALQPNGVARSMRIDYGDFTVGGTLEKIEPLKPASCPDVM